MASIEEVKQIIKDTPISSIITYYYPISKRGGNYEGICPFHSDTKPSLKINDSKGVYKCFACGAAGDAIKFVQDFRNLEFVEAIKDIASNIGLQVDELQKKQANPEYEMGLRVISSAFKLYRKVAKETHPEHFEKFLKNRNLSAEIAEEFGIGYAPGNNAFTSYLSSIKDQKDQDEAIRIAKKIGIIRDSYKGSGQYDFFRDRVMFPIWDHSGQIKGFSSRAVLPDQNPKYLNSGESFIFDKGNILYGFNIAKNYIRNNDAVIVVEGNMDVVVLHQFGFKNAVGAMGVAFSENSARLLSNMTKNIFLGMDSDDAGLAGMDRTNKILLEKGILAKYLNFAPAKDPDEFLQKFGRLKLMERIENAPTFIDFKMTQIIPDPIPQTTDRKLEVLQEIFNLLSPLGENLIAKEFAIKASKSLMLQSSKDDIIQAYVQFLADQQASKSRYQKPQTETVQESKVIEKIAASENAASVQFEPLSIDAPSKMEKKLLEELIAHPESLSSNQITEILDFIAHPEVEQIVQWLKKIYLEIDDADYINIIKAKLEDVHHDELKNVMASGLYNYNKLKLNSTVIEKMLVDFKLRLHNEQLVRKKDELVSKQKKAVTDEESNALLEEIQQVGKEIQKLKRK